MRSRMAGLTTGEGASSMTFCRRRCAVQSRSPEVDRVAVAIGEDLDFDVAAALDQPLEHQRAVAEGALGLATGAGERRGQFARASAPAACRDRRRPRRP